MSSRIFKAHARTHEDTHTHANKVQQNIVWDETPNEIPELSRTKKGFRTCCCVQNLSLNCSGGLPTVCYIIGDERMLTFVDHCNLYRVFQPCMIRCVCDTRTTLLNQVSTKDEARCISAHHNRQAGAHGRRAGHHD